MPGDSPMTERELIDQLCDLRPEWAERRAEIHDRGTYYADGAALATELVATVIGGQKEPWMRKACAVIERALQVGTSGTQTLVVTGLLEAMQNMVLRESPARDVMLDWLGPRSYAAWAELSAFWNGAR
jgi:hypothetical protein